MDPVASASVPIDRHLRIGAVNWFRPTNEMIRSDG